MKTARFTNVVNTCGEPETHLLLTDPGSDKTFQAALKANRVMTVFQAAHGNKADHGEIGYQPGQGRQFLIFPRSLRAFAERTIVGIRYDLLEADDEEAETPATKTKRAAKPKPKAKRDAKTTPKVKAKPPAKTKPAAKIIPFESPPEEDDNNLEVKKLKQQVRRAMKLLEDGKQVAAFNLLKDIAE